ncbi:hypothetical protein QTP88_010217 [Uroleucon formosanum]
MECDSVRSTIERKLKNQDIYLPSDYQKITNRAKIKPFPCNVKNEKQLETQIKAIHYNCNGTIDFKVNFDDEYSDLVAVRKIRKKGSNLQSHISYSQLHKEPLKIPKTKWDHLQQLKAILPYDCHAFYDQIKY